MTGFGPASLAAGVSGVAVLLAAAALRPVAGAAARKRAHRRSAAAAPAPPVPGATGRRHDQPAEVSGHDGGPDAEGGPGIARGAEPHAGVPRGAGVVGGSPVGSGAVGGGAGAVVCSVERTGRLDDDVVAVGAGPGGGPASGGERSVEQARGARYPGPGRGSALVRLRGRAEVTLRSALVAADLEVDPVAARRAWVAGGTAVVVLAALRWGVAGAVVAAALAVTGPGAVLSWRRGQADRRLAAALPGVLEGVAGRLRAGASMAEAIGVAAEEPSGSTLLDSDLRDLQRRVAHGQPFAAAVEAWAERRPAPGVGLVAAALVLGAEAGGARARAIDGVAATLRDRRAVAAEVDALSTQARASALVMMGAPVAFAVLGLLSDPEVARFLLATPAGLACLVVGLGLDALAGWWMVGIARNAR